MQILDAKTNLNFILKIRNYRENSRQTKSRENFYQYIIIFDYSNNKYFLNKHLKFIFKSKMFKKQYIKVILYLNKLLLSIYEFKVKNLNLKSTNPKHNQILIRKLSGFEDYLMQMNPLLIQIITLIELD